MASPLAEAVAVGRTLVAGLVELVYPSRCWVCEEAMQAGPLLICDTCRGTLTHDPHAACPRCASTVGPHTFVGKGCPACRTERFHFDGVFRLGLYQERLREVILRMKHAHGEDLAEVVGELWAKPMAERLKEHTFDAVVPVPLHWTRHWQRGFNQSELLARGLSRQLAVPCRTRWLRRVRRTTSQQGMSATARRRNLRGAFGARPGFQLKGQTVLLVDDVLTSGSTASEAAQALKQAGAGPVFVAVLGRAGGAPL